MLENERLILEINEDSVKKKKIDKSSFVGKKRGGNIGRNGLLKKTFPSLMKSKTL